MEATPLSYGRQSIDADDRAAVMDVLGSAYLTGGPAGEAFEEALAASTGAQHAVVAANGTAALYLAARALRIGHGDAAIVPAMTFMATANAPHLAGAEIVFADVDPDSGLLTPAAFEAAIARTKQAGLVPKAVFPVHLSGQTADMPAIAEIARSEGMLVVEDACHALGSIDDAAGEAARVGSCRYSDAAVFSFHPVKTIACGEGGAVTTKDVETDRSLRQFRSHGIVRDVDEFSERDEAIGPDGQPNPWYHEMPEPSFNFRLSDIQSALGRSQLTKLDRFVARRSDIVARYDRAFAALPEFARPIARVPWCRAAWHLYVLLIDFDAIGTDRGTMMRALGARGIGTQVHYIPVHRQPYYTRRYGATSLTGAERYYRRALSLPLFVDMTDDDVDRVIEAVFDILESR